MNKKEVAKLLAMVVNIYPNIKLADGTIDAWHYLLEDLPSNLAKAALKAVLQKQTYPTLPTIGAIRQAALDIQYGRPLPPALAFAAAQEWAHGDRELDPATLEAARAIGEWELKNSENPSVTRAQFIKVYEAIVNRRNEDAIVSRDVVAGQELKLIREETD